MTNDVAQTTISQADLFWQGYQEKQIIDQGLFAKKIDDAEQKDY